MPRGDKSSYSGKQKRKAPHIEKGSERRGVSRKEAARRAWATVNKEEGGGKKSGPWPRRQPTRVSSRRGGQRSHAGGARAAAKKQTVQTVCLLQAHDKQTVLTVCF